MEQGVEGAPKTSPIPLDDGDVIKKVKAGHADAYSKLVEKYQDRVFNTCWRICGHLEDARDLTQDAFLKAYESLGTFRGQSGFYTWLFRIAMNLALSHKRKERWRPTLSLDRQIAGEGSSARTLAQRLQDRSEPTPDAAAQENELTAQVAHALVNLNEEHRVVIVLRDVEGFDYHDIGAMLEIPVGTVKSRLYRARMALREVMLPLMARED